jgi:glycine dehydrogenase subunit 2
MAACCSRSENDFELPRGSFKTALFIATMRDLVMRTRRGEADRFQQAPMLAPRRRLDETRAARQPKLRWEKPLPYSEAAE